jgi:hypothetical protein
MIKLMDDKNTSNPLTKSGSVMRIKLKKNDEQ